MGISGRKPEYHKFFNVLLLQLYVVLRTPCSLLSFFFSRAIFVGFGFDSLALGFPGGSAGKEPACRPGFDHWVGKIPWRRERLPTPVLVHGVSKSWTGLSDFHLLL